MCLQLAGPHADLQIETRVGYKFLVAYGDTWVTPFQRCPVSLVPGHTVAADPPDLRLVSGSSVWLEQTRHIPIDRAVHGFRSYSECLRHAAGHAWHMPCGPWSAPAEDRVAQILSSLHKYIQIWRVTFDRAIAGGFDEELGHPKFAAIAGTSYRLDRMVPWSESVSRHILRDLGLLDSRHFSINDLRPTLS